MQRSSLIVALLLIACWRQTGYCANLDIYTFAVEQGNFNLIVQGPKAIVYDCGSMRPRVSKSRIEVWDQVKMALRGVKEVRMLVSHADSDHRNLMPTLQELLDKESIRVISPSCRTSIGNALLGSQVTEGTINMFLRHSLGVGVEICAFRSDGVEEHDKNAILLLKRGKYKILLTGDVSGESLRRISCKHPEVFQNISVLYFPHHGSTPLHI